MICVIDARPRQDVCSAKSKSFRKSHCSFFIFYFLERDDIGAGKANRNGEAITMKGFAVYGRFAGVEGVDRDRCGMCVLPILRTRDGRVWGIVDLLTSCIGRRRMR